MNTRRFCFACDLKDDSQLIAAYKRHHTQGNIWPEITKSIKDAGIVEMQIYLTGNRLMMIIEVNDSYDLDRKSKMDANNPKVQEWEKLMSGYQQILPWAQLDEKWVLMEEIFGLMEDKIEK